MTASSPPSPAAIADAMTVAFLGGDLPRLAAVLEHQTALHEGVARQRLVAGAAAMRWTVRLLEELEALEGDGNEAA